jgi:hypothetical protein
MFTYRAPRFIRKTSITFDDAVLATGHCGLFRAPLHLAPGIMPSMAELIDTAPISHIDRDDWELDVKVHMLMKDQYPCIPNWHCDNVPRTAGGTRYDLIGDHSGERDYSATPSFPMYVWVSDEPTTEFLDGDVPVATAPKSHQDVAQVMKAMEDEFAHEAFRCLQANAWYAMDQRTPHRGRKSQDSRWRVFARLTHKSIAPERPVLSVIRRHAQVYLEPDHFTW